MANKGLSAAALLALVIAAPIIAQTPQPVAQGWTGWAQCQITIHAPGYSHRETHLWTVTGAGTKNANMEIYPTSWTVTGDGSLQRANGPTAVSAQWTVNGTLQNVTIGTTLHLDRITVQRWTNHGPARSALTGMEISTTNGVARPRNVILDVQQWAFPAIETGTTSTRATGSNTVPFDGLRGPMNPPSGAMGTAACTWDFARGGASPSSPPPAAVTSSTTPSAGAPVSGGTVTGGTGGSADVSVGVNLRAIPPYVAPANGKVLYDLAIWNNGPSAVAGALLKVTAAAGFSNWTNFVCFSSQGPAGVPCPSGIAAATIQSGLALPNLPPNSGFKLWFDGAVPDTVGSNLSVTATVTPPAGVMDPKAADNSFTLAIPIVASTSSGGSGAPAGSVSAGGTGAGTSTPPSSPTAGPRIVSVAPAAIELGSGCNNEITLTGDGTHWGFGTALDMGPGVRVAIIAPQSPTRLVAFVVPDHSVPTGPRSITVRAGDEVVTLPNAVTVVAREQPMVTVTPSSASADPGFITVTLTGRGTRWEQGITQVFVDAVTAPNKVRLEEFAVDSPTSLTLRLYVYGGASGANEIRIYNRRASSTLPGACEIITLPSGFTVTGAGSQTQSPGGALPSITAVTPAAAPPGARARPVSITATGTHFVQGVSYIDFGELVGATSLTITSPTTANAIINVDPAAPLGLRDITMTTPSPSGTTEVVSRAAAFAVGSTPPPGGTPSPGSTPPGSATTTPSGRYRVTATSVNFRNAEADNPGPAIGDGKGDEIYLTSYAQVYDRRTGNQLSAGPLLRTPVHGDMSGAGGGSRVRAGSATPNGGIATGDEVQLQMPGASPVWLWEGELRDGIDVVVFRPVLWEFDGIEAAWYTVYAQRFPPTAPRQIFDLPVVQAAIPRAGVAFESVPGATMTGAWVPDTQDHPIGSVLNLTGSGAVAGTWTDRVLVLTREKLEPWLAAAGGAGRVEMRVTGEIQIPAAGFGTVQQNVRQDAVADYTLNVTIERRP
jgi:hypothetical protein